MAKGEIKVAAVTMSVVHSKEANLAKYLRFLEEAAGLGANLVVFPEQSLQGYLYSLNHEFSKGELDYHHSQAEPLPGPASALLAEEAREKNLYVVFGLTELGEEAPDPLLYNSVALVGPEGLIGVYRKVHLPGDERHLFRPGDSWPVFSTPFARLGLLICWDQCFPEAARELTLGGAEVMAMPTAWPLRFGPGYDIFSRARAAENHRWFVASNQVGRCDKGEMEYYGHSRIVDPAGRVVAEKDDEGLAVASIPLEESLEKQRKNIFYTLPWRAPATYRRTASG